MAIAVLFSPTTVCDRTKPTLSVNVLTAIWRLIIIIKPTWRFGLTRPSFPIIISGVFRSWVTELPLLCSVPASPMAVEQSPGYDQSMEKGDFNNRNLLCNQFFYIVSIAFSSASQMKKQFLLPCSSVLHGWTYVSGTLGISKLINIPYHSTINSGVPQYLSATNTRVVLVL